MGCGGAPQFHSQPLGDPGQAPALSGPGFRTGKPHNSFAKTWLAEALVGEEEVGCPWSKEADSGPFLGPELGFRGEGVHMHAPCVLGCHHLLTVASLDLNG